ncbi:MAG: ABC transporter permease [Rhodobacter sp.]|jgi:spermidine/putrescine transport system permease protein|nr:ABC transporter permease [Rhodobacter sp.]
MTGPIARRALALLFWVTAAVIYLPIGVMAVFSFSTARYQILPSPDYTIEWYGRVFTDGQYSAGFVNSVLLAGSVSLVATLIGFACAYSLVNARFPGKAAFTFLILAPLAVPLLLVGIALRIWTTMLGLQPSLPLAGVGQVLYVLPLAVLNLRNRIAQLPKSHEEAAWALGASRVRAIVDVILPACRASLIATFILCFTFAFDEFVIAYFLTNFSVTLPIKIWTTLVTGFDPTINALGTMVFVFSLSLGVTAQWLLMRKDR